jgi:hypothetical protein
MSVSQNDRITFRGATYDRSAAAHATDRDAYCGADDLIKPVSNDTVCRDSRGLIHQGQFLPQWIEDNGASYRGCGLAFPIDANLFLRKGHRGDSHGYQKYHQQTFGFHIVSCLLRNA